MENVQYACHLSIGRTVTDGFVHVCTSVYKVIRTITLHREHAGISVKCTDRLSQFALEI